MNYYGSLNIEIPDLTSYDLLNAREKLELEYLVGKYDARNVATDVNLKRQYNYLLSQVNKGVDTYWLSKPLRTGVGQTHNLRVEGGDYTFRYSASVQFNNTVGVMKESERKNFNGSLMLSYQHETLRFTNNTMLGFNNSSETPYGSFSDYVNMNPYFEPYDEYGNVIKTLGLLGDGASSRWSKGIANPLWNPETNTYDKSNSTSITNNFAINWDVFKGFTLRAALGVVYSMGGGDMFYSADHTMFADYTEDEMMEKGEYTKSESKSISLDCSLNLQYAHTFAEKHALFAGLNLSARQSESSSNSVTAIGFVNEDFDFLSMALGYADGKPSGSESKNRSVGMTFNANYSYEDLYFADFTMTYDGNSQFGSDNRFAPFWSLGLGWNLHNAKFMTESGWMDRLKLRGSIGTNGSQAFSSYQSLTRYQYNTSSRYYTWIGTDVSSLGNSSLKWSQQMKYNVGLDLEMFDRRLQMVVDYYIQTTKNQISSIEIPSSTGFTSYPDNIGTVENRGLELRLTGMILRNEEKDLYWSLSGSIAHNTNKIKELSQAMKDAQAEFEADESSNPYVIYKEGYSMNAIWVVPSYGIDPATGKELFVGDNGEPTFTWSAARLTDCGDSQPKFYGNINTTFRWKELMLTASFSYRLEGQLYNSTLIDKVENANYDQNVDQRVYSDRWKEPGDKAFFKSIYETETTKKTSRFVQDERTFRCNSLNLSYDFEGPWIKKIGVDYCTLQAGIDDLFYISSVKRERGTSYPFSRYFTLSFNISF